MKHLGDYDLSTVVYGKFTTYDPATGQPATLSGGSGPGLSVYKDNSTTQSSAGVTLTTDFDGITGLNHFAIDTSADGGFYSTGSFFDVVINNGTVGSVLVVGAAVASFTLRKDSALKPTTAARTLDVSATGEAGLDWANIGSPTTAVNLSGTNIDVDQVVASVSGAVGSVTGNVGGNVTGSVGTVNALAADSITSTALAASAVTEIQSGLATSAAVDDLPTVAEFNARTLAAASYATAAALAVVDGLVDGIDLVTDKLDGMLTLGSGESSYQYTELALANAPSGSGPTVQQIVDGVWDEVLTAATHNVPNSAGRRLRQLANVVVHDGTAQGPGTGTNQIQLDAGASATDGAYDPALVAIVGGTGTGQCRLILQYAGATRTATVDRDWKVNPDATSVFQITSNPGREHVNEGLAQAGGANTITLNALASGSNDVYVGQMVFIRSGTGADQVGLVTAYNGATKVATVDPDWAVVPDSTSAYAMLPIGPVLLGSVVHTGATIPTVTTVGTVNALAADSVSATALAASAVTEIQSGLATAVAVDDLPTLAEFNARTLAAASYATAASLTTVEGKVDTVDTVVDAVKAKTDSLTFTVAGKVDSNITHVIADPVQTNGSTATNWGGTP